VALIKNKLKKQKKKKKKNSLHQKTSREWEGKEQNWRFFNIHTYKEPI
jgi:hypothetical protein